MRFEFRVIFKISRIIVNVSLCGFAVRQIIFNRIFAFTYSENSGRNIGVCAGCAVAVGNFGGEKNGIFAGVGNLRGSK